MIYPHRRSLRPRARRPSSRCAGGRRCRCCCRSCLKRSRCRRSGHRCCSCRRRHWCGSECRRWRRGSCGCRCCCWSERGWSRARRRCKRGRTVRAWRSGRYRARRWRKRGRTVRAWRCGRYRAWSRRQPGPRCRSYSWCGGCRSIRSIDNDVCQRVFGLIVRDNGHLGRDISRCSERCRYQNRDHGDPVELHI